MVLYSLIYHNALWEPTSPKNLRLPLYRKYVRIPLQIGHPFRFNSATDSD